MPNLDPDRPCRPGWNRVFVPKEIPALGPDGKPTFYGLTTNDGQTYVRDAGTGVIRRNGVEPKGKSARRELKRARLTARLVDAAKVLCRQCDGSGRSAIAPVVGEFLPWSKCQGSGRVRA